jgi:nicotinamide riboside transporter PnuC
MHGFFRWYADLIGGIVGVLSLVGMTAGLVVAAYRRERADLTEFLIFAASIAGVGIWRWRRHTRRQPDSSHAPCKETAGVRAQPTPSDAV